MAAPTITDVKSYLTKRCGLPTDSVVATDDATLTKALAWALAQLSRLTGYSPFVAGAASDLFVEVVGMVGRFPNGATGTVAVSLDGVTYVAGTDYRIYPLNGGRGEYLKWLRLYPPSKPLTVNAAWGYGSDYPDDVWEAVVMLAAAFCLVSFAAGQTGYLGSSWTDGDVAQVFGTGNRLATEKGIAQVAPGVLASDAFRVFKEYERAVAYG